MYLMVKIISIFIVFFILTFHQINIKASEINDHRIAVLVNDQLITSYDIIQRMKMNAILTGVDITQENNNFLANNVVEELIREKLKSEKIKQYDINISNDEYLQQEDAFFKNLSLNKIKLIEIFNANDINYIEFTNFLTNEISWQKLISGMYYRLTSTSEIEIEEIIMKNPGISEDMAKNIIIQKQLDLKSSKMIRDMFNEATIEYK